MKLTLIKMFFSHFSWSDRRSAHRDLQSDRSAGGLHDRRLHDVDQPLHHWNDLSISSGQSDTTSIQLSASVIVYTHPNIYQTCRDIKQAYIHLEQLSLQLLHVKSQYTHSYNIINETKRSIRLVFSDK